MLLPLRDHPNPEGFRPWVTWGLIVLNVGVYLAVTVPAGPQYHEVVLRHGFRPAAPGLFDLFTSMFLHAGLMHLAGNMLFLWIYGDNVEHRLGRGRYLLAYLLTGVLATASHAVLNAGSPIPMVGASGAISGILGFYFLWFPRHRVWTLVLIFPFWFGRYLVPARLLLGVFVVLDNLLPMLVTTGSDVAYGAHLGGFVAGLVAAVLWRSRAPRVHPEPPARARQGPVISASAWQDRKYRGPRRPKY